MDKTTVVISCPIDTYSGYGARARDFVKSLMMLGEYDVKVVPQRWGNTRFGYLEDHNEYDLQSLLIGGKLNQQPDIFIQHTVPNEFQRVGKYNIGLTAGIETTIASGPWIEGCNRMDLILTSAEHAKEVFEKSIFYKQDPQTGQQTQLRLTTPVEVLFEGIDLSKYFPDNERKAVTDLSATLDSIDENFCFLSVGHWLQGVLGEDRKNIGYTIKTFLETFKNTKNPPALVLKTQQATSSILDREKILDQIAEIRQTVKGVLPNVYLIHGEISDSEINELYNHPKIKAFVTHTKGEGFGRPILEFSAVNKPVICSGWSAPTEYLDKEFCTLLPGVLKPIHPSAVQQDVIISESQWFQPDDAAVGKAYKDLFKNYEKYLKLARRQGHKSRRDFTLAKMTEKLGEILKSRLPEFPKQVQLQLPKLNLPKLKKIGEEPKQELPKLNLPKLKKI